METSKEHVKIVFSHVAFEEESIESAWAIKFGDYYQLDNILFYAKEYSLGDIIEVKQENDFLYAKKLVKESGHSTVRILVSDKTLVSKLRVDLIELGCSSELSNFEKLIAIDIPPEISFLKIRDFLDNGEKNGLWEYEEACISQEHRKLL